MMLLLIGYMAYWLLFDQSFCGTNLEFNSSALKFWAKRAVFILIRVSVVVVVWFFY